MINDKELLIFYTATEVISTYPFVHCFLYLGSPLSWIWLLASLQVGMNLSVL
jgi:hypothetical protein